MTTISDTMWAGVSAQPQSRRLKARRCCLPRTRGAFIAAELVVLAAALFYATRGGTTLGMPILVASCELLFHVNNLDRSTVSARLPHFSIDVLESVSLACLASALLFYIFPVLAASNGAALAAVLSVGLLPVILRPFLRYLVTHKRFAEGILIVGTGELAGKLYRAMANGGNYWKENQHRAGELLEFPESHADAGTSVDFAELNDILVRDRISRVIVAEQDAQSREKLAAALLDRRLRGLKISDAVDFYEKFSGRIWVEGLSTQWFVFTGGFSLSKASVCLKRCSDVIFALLLLFLTAPLLVVIAVAIKIDSAGPVLFRQVRVGLHGKVFVIYKFRSMRNNAEFETGPVWTKEQDERVTSVGRLLRKFRLDEILQAFNVLRGDMSLVGPRPERPYFVDRLEQKIPFYNLRHYVKPGITGWAQVMYPYGDSIEAAYEKLQYDFYYAKHKSFGCDTGILLKTLKIVLLGRGR
ncbi:MAG TPA: exopolysaccharide biosynthesis polyprenyl glycosylphosphotransferase [Bryobacteraceae bacterium]|nr:exopolysaccharide biosynthesis polyprenyl glycosylphosphotransferase [Bryobacteraceae bacterium]HXJ41420.1 exopolysaccharide biosynthesis polyprenyl glycosylphosphotransferase [Bryobacteraceae bacterium]